MSWRRFNFSHSDLFPLSLLVLLVLRECVFHFFLCLGAGEILIELHLYTHTHTHTGGGNSVTDNLEQVTWGIYSCVMYIGSYECNVSLKEVKIV